MVRWSKMFQNNVHPKFADRFTVHIIGASTSALLLQSYRDSLRAHGIVHVDSPMKGSCLVTATDVVTMLYAPFIALGKRLSSVIVI